MKPVYYLIILTSLISFKIVDNRVIRADPVTRDQLQARILSGEAEFPHQYRILVPAMGYALQQLFHKLTKDPLKAHIYSYELIILIAFLLLYYCLFLFLNFFFTDISCMIGILLFQILIPLSITGVWQEGDFYNVLFFTIGLLLMFKSKDYYLPLVLGIGMINNEQILFLFIFYIAYLVSQNKLNTKKSYFIIALSAGVCIFVYILLKWKFGFRESETLYYALHNFESIPSILSLWITQVVIFVWLSIKSFKYSDNFFKLGLMSVGLYFILFFIYGNIGELAKFLPAYLILIPMSLQVLTGEKTTYASDFAK